MKVFFEYYNFPYKIHVEKSDYLEHLFETVISRADGNRASDNIAISGIIMAIVAYYFGNCSYTENKYSFDDVDKVIKHVKNNCNENYSLEELAKYVNLSPNYFVRKFNKRTSHSPIHFVKMIKLERAKFLFEHSNESVSAIMEQNGFLDLSHFSKIFKACYGHSPRKFRDI